MDYTIEWHDRLGSTNAAIRERIIAGKSIDSGLVIAARDQTGGRGRQDRRWVSPPNSNLCFSLYLESSAPLIQIPSFTMAAALAVSEMLNAKGIRAAPKWPNDVLVEDRKICGILSERVEHGTKRGIIAGIGLNVNMTADEITAIDRPATSMLIERGEASDPARVLDELLPQLGFWISRWECGGFEGIRDIWIERAGPIGKNLSVHDGGLRRSGLLAGFGKHGELLLETEAGLEIIWSGEVT